LLIGGEGRLTAVFLLGRSSDHALLYARLVSSRLALPAYTRLVALVDEGAERRLEGSIRSFDLIASAGDSLRELGRYCAGDAKTKANHSDLVQMQRLHHIRYSTALQITRLRRRHELPRQRPAEVIDALRGRGITASLTVRSAHFEALYKEPNAADERVFALERRTNRSERVDLLKIWTIGQLSRFTLDAGVPYLGAADILDLLLVEDWPSSRFDPEKLVRAAAFGGLITAIASPVDQITELIDRTRWIMRKRIRERTQSPN
jgi:hypothetical protein